MTLKALRDLQLAGVQWEITDTPITMPKTQKQPTMPEPVNEIRNMADVMRPTNCVVPPIAPIQTISVDTAKSLASRPTDLNTLNRLIGEFNHPLRGTATNTVLPHFGNGKLMILTDIPSTEDDASGNILTGGAGELMNKMLNAIGESRATTSIVPMLFWRTPGGRTPTRDELDMARPFVNRAIELVQPRVILTLGTLPANEIAGINLAKAHGAPVTREDGMVIMPIFHPNYLILKPAAKRDVWTALQNVQNILKNAE